MTLYRHILGQSWQFLQRHRGLWFFGLLATLWGTGGIYEIIIRGLGVAGGRDFYLVKLWLNLSYAGITWPIFRSFIFSRPWQAALMALIVAAMFLIILFIYWLITCSQITVIRHCASGGQQPVLATFSQSRKFVWSVLAINFLGAVMSLVIWLILSLALMGLSSAVSFWSVWSLLVYLVLFILGIIAVLAVAFITLFSIIYVVVRDYDLLAAVPAAVRLLVKHWLVALEIAAVLLIFTLITALIFLLLTALMMGPLYLSMIAASLLQSPWLYIISFLVITLIVLAGGVLLAAGLTTFQLITWTTLFVELEQGNVTSKLHRLAADKLGYQQS